MTITTITIETVDYTSYASVAEADALLNTDPTREAAWEALDTDGKGKKLVAATRRMDLLNWEGSKTGTEAAQANAWPRTGATYADGSDVSTSEVPQAVEDATILLAGSITLDASASNSGTSGSNQKRLKAGSVEIEYFKPTIPGKALQDETAFKMVKPFLAGAGSTSTSGALSSGTDQSSSFCDDDMGFERTEGFS